METTKNSRRLFAQISVMTSQTAHIRNTGAGCRFYLNLQLKRAAGTQSAIAAYTREENF